MQTTIQNLAQKIRKREKNRIKWEWNANAKYQNVFFIQMFHTTRLCSPFFIFAYKQPFFLVSHFQLELDSLFSRIIFFMFSSFFFVFTSILFILVFREIVVLVRFFCFYVLVNFFLPFSVVCYLQTML